jgi:hypothetical protein
MAATKEQENFYRAASIILQLCSKVLREGLTYYNPPSTCPPTIKRKGITLNKSQETIVLDIAKNNSYDDCDISLLYVLYRALVIGRNFRPTKGWGKPVPATADTLGDDLERIRLRRNNDIGHSNDARMEIHDFVTFDTEMMDIMMRADSNYNGTVHLASAGSFVTELQRLRTCRLDDKDLNKLQNQVVLIKTGMTLHNSICREMSYSTESKSDGTFPYFPATLDYNGIFPPLYT